MEAQHTKRRGKADDARGSVRRARDTYVRVRSASASVPIASFPCLPHAAGDGGEHVRVRDDDPQVDVDWTHETALELELAELDRLNLVQAHDEGVDPILVDDGHLGELWKVVVCVCVCVKESWAGRYEAGVCRSCEDDGCPTVKSAFKKSAANHHSTGDEQFKNKFQTDQKKIPAIIIRLMWLIGAKLLESKEKKGT